MNLEDFLIEHDSHTVFYVEHYKGSDGRPLEEFTVGDGYVQIIHSGQAWDEVVEGLRQYIWCEDCDAECNVEDTTFDVDIVEMLD